MKPTATKYAVLYQLAVQALRVPPYSLLRDVVNWLRRKLEDDTGNHRYKIAEPRVGNSMAV